jgi:hypothetical protein
MRNQQTIVGILALRYAPVAKLGFPREIDLDSGGTPLVHDGHPEKRGRADY